MLERVVLEGGMYVKRVERMDCVIMRERDGQKHTFERGSISGGHMQARDVEDPAQRSPERLTKTKEKVPFLHGYHKGRGF